MKRYRNKDIVAFRTGSIFFNQDIFEDYFGLIEKDLEQVINNELHLTINLISLTTDLPFNKPIKISKELAKLIIATSLELGFTSFKNYTKIYYLPKSKWEELYLKGFIKC